MYRQVTEFTGGATVPRTYQIEQSELRLYYNNQFSIAIEYLVAGTTGDDESDWIVYNGQEFSNERAADVASLDGDTITITTEFRQMILDALDPDEGGHLRVRLLITPAIEAEVGGQNEFPANNISVESLNAAFRKRDLQDLHSRQFAFRGDRGAQGWSPILAIEDFMSNRYLKVVRYVGGDGTAPNVPEDAYLGPDGLTSRDNAVNFIGVHGPTGDDGNNGWTPLINIVEDGDRRVFAITGYSGGEGTNPFTEIQYLGPLGLVTDISEAVDVRGVAGVAGPAGDAGAAGRDGAQGRYAIRVYIALTEAERTVNGQLRNPNRPTATGYSPATNTLQGLTSHPAWSLDFPSGDEITDDDKDVFESFATYDPATDTLSSFTTPFQVSNERGPSGPAGIDGVNGFTPEFALRNVDEEPAREVAVYPSMGANTQAFIHISDFIEMDIETDEAAEDITHIMPGYLPTGQDINFNKQITVTGRNAGAQFINLQAGYNNRTTLNPELVRGATGSEQSIPLYVYLNATGALCLACSHQRISDTTNVRFQLFVDGVAYDSVVESGNDFNLNVPAGNVNRHTQAVVWQFVERHGQATVKSILEDTLWHHIEFRFIDDSGRSGDDGPWQINFHQRAADQVTFNEKQTLALTRFAGGGGRAPVVAARGLDPLYLNSDGYTPYETGALAVQGEEGQAGADGEYILFSYLNSDIDNIALHPTAIGNSGSLTDERNFSRFAATTDVEESHRFAEAYTSPATGEITYLLMTKIVPDTVTRRTDPNRPFAATFENLAIIPISGTQGPKGDKGDKGDTGVAGPPGGAPPTGRNFIINGGMIIDQRGRSQSAAFEAKTDGTTSSKFVKDRWQLSTDLKDYALTVSTAKTIDLKSRVALRLTNSVGTQVIGNRAAWQVGTNEEPLTEGNISLKTTLDQSVLLKAGYGKTGASNLQLSFMFKGPLANITYTLKLTDHSGDVPYYKYVPVTITAANTWERKTIEIEPNGMGGARDLDNINNKGLEIELFLVDFFSANNPTANNGWASDTSAGASVGGTKYLAQVETDELDQRNQFHEIGDVQLEIRNAVSEFEIEPYDDTLRKCQKYFVRQRCGVLSASFDNQATTGSIRLPSRIHQENSIRVAGFTGASRDFGIRVVFEAPANMRLEVPRLGAGEATFALENGLYYRIPTQSAATDTNPFVNGGVVNSIVATPFSRATTGHLLFYIGFSSNAAGTLNVGHSDGPVLDFDAEFE